MSGKGKVSMIWSVVITIISVLNFKKLPNTSTKAYFLLEILPMQNFLFSTVYFFSHSVAQIVKGNGSQAKMRCHSVICSPVKSVWRRVMKPSNVNIASYRHSWSSKGPKPGTFRGCMWSADGQFFTCFSICWKVSFCLQVWKREKQGRKKASLLKHAQMCPLWTLSQLERCIHWYIMDVSTVKSIYLVCVSPDHNSFLLFSVFTMTSKCLDDKCKLIPIFLLTRL